jgi:hypothetical protein
MYNSIKKVTTSLLIIIFVCPLTASAMTGATMVPGFGFGGSQPSEKEQLIQMLSLKIMELQAQLAEMINKQGNVTKAGLRFSSSTSISTPQNLNSNIYSSPVMFHATLDGIEFDYYLEHILDIGYTNQNFPYIHKYKNGGKFAEWRMIHNNELVGTISLLDRTTSESIELFKKNLESPTQNILDKVSITKLASTAGVDQYEVYDKKTMQFGYFVTFYPYEYLDEKMQIVMLVPFGVTEIDSISTVLNAEPLKEHKLHFVNKFKAKLFSNSISSGFIVYTENNYQTLTRSALFRMPTIERKGYDKDTSEQQRFRTGAAMAKEEYAKNATYEGVCKNVSMLAGPVEFNNGGCRDERTTFVAYYKLKKGYFCIDSMGFEGSVDKMSISDQVCKR